MANNPLPDAALAELDRLQHGTTPRPWLYGKVWLDHVPNYMAVIALHNAYPALRQRLTDAEARLAEVERERDEWRAQLKRVVGEHSRPRDCYATGPLTGDPIRDLISCPSCEAIAMELAQQRREGK